MSTNAQAKRTPDKRFEDLPGYAFKPHYVDDLPSFEGLRVHYLDEGAKDADKTFLCLHGQPSWSYLYRKMIPVFAGSGARVIAPDWLGFGRSDKPIEDTTYSYHFHRTMMIELIEQLDLTNITLVCQDWGGVLGLTIPQDMPERFARLIVMNTALPQGNPAGEGFREWLEYNRANPDLNVGELIASSTPHLTPEEIAAYNAPFPELSFKAGVRRFPELVMVDPSMEGVGCSKSAAQWWKNDWAGQSFMAVGMKDSVITPRAMETLRSIIRGCPAPMQIEDGGHFVQEWGEDIAREALRRFGDID